MLRVSRDSMPRSGFRNGNAKKAGVKAVGIPKANRAIRPTRYEIRAVRTRAELDSIDLLRAAVEHVQRGGGVDIPDAERRVTRRRHDDRGSRVSYDIGDVATVAA